MAASMMMLSMTLRRQRLCFRLTWAFEIQPHGGFGKLYPVDLTLLTITKAMAWTQMIGFLK
jgi:hypothetical protein